MAHSADIVGNGDKMKQEKTKQERKNLEKIIKSMKNEDAVGFIITKIEKDKVFGIWIR